jgi:phage terminase Nu1 subunit (DNA packaging protein)
MEELRAQDETLRAQLEELRPQYQPIRTRLTEAQRGLLRIPMVEWNTLVVEVRRIKHEMEILSRKIINNLLEMRRISDDPLSVVIDFPNAYLNRVHLIGQNLGGAILRGAELEEANLEGSHLEGAHLEEAHLEGAILTGAHLNGAHLNGAHLDDAVLDGAHLNDAILDGAILDGVVLEEFDLTAEQLRVIIVDHPIYEGNVSPPPIPGVAYEIHNAFEKFKEIKEKYLALIDQKEVDIGDDIYSFIERAFTENINELFSSDIADDKIDQFNRVFSKIRGYIQPSDAQLIAKSINFVFSQDDTNFKRQYIMVFLDETCNAYSGSGDNTSCVKGIIERFILSIGAAVQIICVAGCENETFKQLDELMNGKFTKTDMTEAFQKWYQDQEIIDKVTPMSEEERKKDLVDFLVSEANRLDKKYNMAEINQYVDELGEFFVDLTLGGKKTRKSMKRKKSMKKSKKIRKSMKKKRSKKTSIARR